MPYLDKLFSLSGKVAIVTGGNRGLGKGISQALLEAGATVVIVGTNIERTKAAVTEFKTQKLDAHTFQCDIADSKEINALTDHVQKSHGRLDILVNNAGITQGAPIAEYTDQAWDLTLKIDLHAPFALTRALSPLMETCGGGSIINITSLSAERGFAGNPAYAAAKGGLRQLTKALADELATKGIRVNSIGPGYMRTDMTSQSWENPERRAKLTEKTMLGRWGMPDDLAGVTILLASDASSYITGQEIYVDGGWLAKGM